MTFKGFSRPCYTILCLAYYTIKDLLIILLVVAYRYYKFLLYDFWIWLFQTDKKSWFMEKYGMEIYDDTYDDEDDDEDDEDDLYNLDIECEEEELPFCQLFAVSPDMSLLVDHVEMCPDETAFIRVVDNEGYTPLYKRKVRKDKLGRFIVFNGSHYYLNDAKTSPVISRK